MGEQRKALVAFHSDLGISMAGLFEDMGYEVSEVHTLEDMLENMGLPRNADANSKPTVHFDFYVMDTNLGIFNGATCEPAERVYNFIREEVEEQRAQFMSFTGNDNAEKLAREKGIPVISKTDYKKSIAFYMGIRRV